MTVPPAPGYSPQLDGLRAVAVTAVAWSHWLPAWQFGLPLGAGVHLFFVLSGFLITRILLDLRTAPRRWPAIGRFYVRRALRLFPAFFLVLGVAVWAAVPLARETWPWHAAYLSNVFIAGEAQWQGHLSHFWSLAVEEQFYLVWPWLVVFAPARWLGAVVAAAVLLGPLSRFARGVGRTARERSGRSCPAAAPIRSDWARGWRSPRRPPTTAARGSPCAPGCRSWPGACGSGSQIAEAVAPVPPAVAVWRQVLQGVVFAWVVHRAVAGFAGPGGRVLAHPVAIGVGRISYGVYLIHAFAPVVVFAVARTLGVDAWVPTSTFARAGLYAATTLALAGLMWRWVERPVLAWKSRVPYA